MAQELGAGGDVKPLGKDADARAAELLERKSNATQSWQDSLQLVAAKAKPKAGPKPKAWARMTNFKFLLGFNHQLEQGTGHGLKSWMLDEPLGRLPPSTVRVLVEFMCPFYLRLLDPDVFSNTNRLVWSPMHQSSQSSTAQQCMYVATSGRLEMSVSTTCFTVPQSTAL